MIVLVPWLPEDLIWSFEMFELQNYRLPQLISIFFFDTLQTRDSTEILKG